MGIAALEKRVGALEQALSATGKPCSCRTGEQTTYHSAEELRKLMDIRCPGHGFRDLGVLRWLPSALPLRSDDENLCSCPSCPVREFLLGKRGPLTEVEQEKEEQRWEAQGGASSEEAFRREQALLENLFRQYEYSKRSSRGTNG